MDWTLAKELNRAALLRVLAALFAMVGLVAGGTVASLPRHLRLSVLRLLRPAESAARRLVVLEAQGLDVELGASRSGGGARTNRGRSGERAPSFPLIESLPRTGPPARKYAPGPGPRLSFFDGFDPVIETPVVPTPDDPMDAGRLCRRLHAVQAVLGDLSKAARRLALWQARRDAAPPQSGRTRPLRPGSPPGYRARAVHEVDGILVDCHELALYALAPDTS